MARPKTATNILELKGAFKTHPERKRKNEPAGSPIVSATAPAHLSDGQSAAWAEIVAVVPAGVLTGSDSIHLEIVACLLAEFRAEHGLLDTARITRLTSEMGKLGLNPSARAGLSVEKPKVNKYAE
jgi:phage terminase small subunit